MNGKGDLESCDCGVGIGCMLCVMGWRVEVGGCGVFGFDGGV